MVKKIILFYSSIIAIIMLLLMFLLITITLVDISRNGNIKIANINTLAKSKTNKNNLKISTDKNIYTANENVLVTFNNFGKEKIAQNKNSSLVVKCRPDMGSNYELAFIEHKNENGWVAIEPVSRCSNDCNKACLGNHEIKAKDKTSFVWSQTVLKCTEEGKPSTSRAPLGVYRVSSATWDDSTNSFVEVYSNVFKISSISKK